jgi:hypothetical protein
MLISRCDIRRAVSEKKDLLFQAIFDRHEGIAYLLLKELPHLNAEGEVRILDIMWAAVLQFSPRLVQKFFML